MKMSKTLLTSIVSLLLCSIVVAAPPLPPQNVQQAWLGLEALLLWDDTAEATSYRIYRSDNTNTTWTLVGSSAVPRFRDATFQFLPSFYLVTAVNADGESAGSELSTVAFADQYTFTVYEPQTWDGTLSPTNAIVRWSTSDPNGAQGLMDWGVSSTNFNFFAINTNYLGSQSFDLTNLMPLTVYYYRLTSIGSNRAGVVYLGYFGTPDTNHPPVAEALTIWGVVPPEGGWLGLNGYDSNSPPKSLTFRVLTAPTNGTLSDIQPGWGWSGAVIKYTPASVARGYDRFQFVVNNGTWDSAPALVTLTNWVNTPPAVTNAQFTTLEDTPINITLPEFDAEGDPVTFRISDFVWNGSVTGTPPNVTFTPNHDFNGSAYFSYTVNDGFVDNYGWMQIEVTPVNDKPIILTNITFGFTAWEDQPANIWLYLYDSDWTGGYELVQVNPPAHGTLSGDWWNLIYTPETNFFGTDYFTISIREGDGATSDPVTFPIEVQSLNDFPIGFGQNVTALEDVPLLIVPTGYDAEGDTLAFSVGSYPTNGWIESFETNFVYHSYLNFVGQDAFSFYARDWSGIWSPEPSWIHIQVVDANDPPDAHDVYPLVHAEATFTGSLSASDPEGATLNCEVVNGPANGTVTVSGTNFNYTPFPGLSQTPDNFTYRASDGLATSAVATVWIWIANTNTVPEARDQAVTITQDTVTFFVLDVFDPDSEPLQTLIQSGPTNGTIEFELAGATYRPAPNFLGSDSFSYRIWDHSATSAIATVSINVVPPNVAPVAYSTNLMTQRDMALNFSLLASDGDGNALTYIVTSSPAHGSLSGTAPNLVYTPASGFMGTDSFTFKANDGTVDGKKATVTITTTRPNVAPTATSQSVTTAEDTLIAITLSAADGDGDPLTYIILSQPSHGTLSGSGANRTYTPAANYNGPDSFTFTVNDGLVNGNTATVSLTITPVNDAPVLYNPTTIRTLPEDWVTSWNPSATDPDGDPITFRLVTPPSHGTLDTTNWLYRAAKDYNGGDYFSWVVNDGQVDSALGTFSISITPVNDAPVATNQSVAVDTEISSVITPNATDVDNSSLTLTVMTQPQHGTVTVNGTTFTYQPVAGYTGSDSFAYRASDGSLNSGIATISISVAPINNPPVRVSPDRGFTITEDWFSTFNTLASDADGDLLTYRIVTQPTHGTVTQLSSNTWRYQPAWNWYGDDSLTWTASDGQFDCAIGTVWFHVVSQNDRPMSGYDILTNAEDSVFSVTLWSGDVDGDALIYTIITAPTNGVLSGSGSNRIYTPNPNFFGGDSLVFKVNDGQMDSFPGTIWFTITNVNDVPIANAASITTAEDTVANITLTGSDVEGDALTFAVVNGPAHGTLSGAAPNLVYSPSTNFFGSDAFTFSVSDGAANSTATVNITVTPVNDLPAPQNLHRRIYQDRIVRLWWNEVPGAQSYLIYRADETNGPFTLLASGITATNFNDATAAYQHTCWYRVSTSDGAAEGQPSSSVLARPDWTGTITLFMHEWVIRGRTAIVNFVSDLPDGTEGIFEYGTNREYGVFLENTNIYGFQRFYLSNLEPATVYYFRITATDANGNALVSTTNAYLQDYFVTQAPPIAENQMNGVYEDSLYGPVLSTLTGTDGYGFWRPLTFALLTLPSHGTVTMTGESSFTYVPETNFFGIDSFTFKANDGELDSAPGTVSIEVWPVNDGPIVSDITVGMMEDTSIVIPITAADVENNAIQNIYVGSPLHGTAVADGTNIIYTPTTNFFGTDEFSYEVSDTGFALGNMAWIHINVTNVSDAPMANAQNITTAEDTAASITLTGSDADGDVLAYSVVSGPSHGTLSGTAPNLVYTAEANFYGSDSFVFSVSDSASSATATVNITVTPVNDLPAPDGLHRRIYADDGIVRLWWNAVPGAQSYSVYRADTNSPFSLLASGITETNFNDTNALWQQTYWYRIVTWDGTAEGAPSNPVLARREGTGLITTFQDYWLILGTTARVQFCSSLVNGTEGMCEYGTTTNYNFLIENTNLLGCHNFNLGSLIPQTTYYYRLTATDSNGNAVAYWNSFTTRAAPVADPQSASMAEDSTRDFTVTGHISPGTGYAPPITYAIVNGPAHGTLTLLFGNVFRYRPATNYNGPDSFTFKVNDTDQDSAPATVSITITPVNDAPVVTVPTPSANWQITASTVTPQWSTVVPVYSQFRYGPISGLIWWVASPNYGTQHSVTVSGLAPNWDYVYGISVWTASGDTNWVTGGFHTATNHAPIATSNQTVYAIGNVATNIYPAVSDADAQTLHFTIVASPTNGSFISTGSNWFRYLPATNFIGVDGFAYRVDDGFATSQVAAVTIYVFPPNGAPIALPYSTNALEDVAVTVPFRGVDAQSNALIYSILAFAAHGTLTVTASNATYRPMTNYNGFDSFSYRAFDGTNWSAPAWVTLTITPVNDRPIANNQGVAATEDVAQSITLTGSDVDFNSLTYTVASGPAHGTLNGSGNSRTYTPATNYNGPDSFTFFVNDGLTNSATATVTITVNAVNDGPIALPQSLSLGEDMEITFSVTGTDVDSGALTFEVVTSPTNGTLNIAGTNYTYRPATNFSGGDSLTFRAFDGALWSAPATISITVTSMNDGPIAYPQSVSLAEDGSRAITLTGFDSDGETIAYSIVSSALHGTLSGTPPDVTYQPDANYNGADSFTFRVTDGNTFSAAATVSITVSPINDAPVATNRTFAATEDTSLNFTLTGSDVDGDTLTFRITSTPLHGSVTGTGPSFTYTPLANYSGTDSFYYTANDGTEDGNTAAVILTIAAVNDAPSVTNQNVATTEDSAATFAPLAGDIEGDALNFTILTAPTNGTAVVSGGNLIYTPNTNYNGTDSFEYQAHDPNGGDSTARVSITISLVNDAPIANAQNVTVAEDGSRNIALTGTDVDGDTLSYAVVSGPTHGTLSGTAPNVVYAPAPNYNGADSFTFSVNDGTETATATVSITVTAVNDVPVASAQNVTLAEDGSRSITLAGTDVDGDSLLYAIVSGPTHGTLSGTAPDVVYTPVPNYNGPDSFTFRVNDGTTNSATASVSITVTAVNDAPVANTGSRTLAEDTSGVVTLTASDLDGDALTFGIVTVPLHGTLSGTGASRTYTPAANYNGPDSFTFLVNDGTTNSAAATVSITVTPVNDAPSLSGFGAVIDEDTPYNFTLTASDVDNDPLTYVIVNNPTNGTLTGTGPTFTYTPNLNFNGQDALTIKASDGTAFSGNGYINFTIHAVNDPAVANPQTVSVNEDSSAVITLTGSDVEGGVLKYTRLSDPAHGTITGTPLFITSTNAVLTYTPATNYNGPDSFTFRVSDPLGAFGAAATVTINVAAMNDAPVANAQSATVIYNTAKAITLTGSDLEGSGLSYSIVTTPTNGALSGTAPNLTYTPTVGSAGADNFTFRVNDGSSNSAAAMVSITTQNPVAISPAPTSLAVTVPTALGTLILNWSCTATNEDGFKIERSLNGSSGWAQVGTTGIDIHTFTNSGLTSNTRYYYRVRSYNRLGNSAYSNTVNAKAK